LPRCAAFLLEGCGAAGRSSPASRRIAAASAAASREPWLAARAASCSAASRSASFADQR
jgi:hypothetical protein